MIDLTEEEILGPATALESPRGQEVLKDYGLAKEALAKADAAELFVLYQKALKERNEVIGAMEILVKHMLGSKDEARTTDPNAIAAIREVALQTIAFAREVGIGKGKLKQYNTLSYPFKGKRKR